MSKIRILRPLPALVALASSCAVLAGCGRALGGGAAALPTDGAQSVTRRAEAVAAPLSSSAWTYMGLDSFFGDYQTPVDGIQPNGDLIGVGGALYGTAQYGGDGFSSGFGYGVVFRLSAGNVHQNIYRFKGGSDGANPQAGLLAYDGQMYGTTSAGGDSAGDGTVFALDSADSERVLYRFRAGSDGANPFGNLVELNGKLYGTTRHGGTGNHGVVFELSPGGAERVVYRFSGRSDGDAPNSLLAQNGALYGTAYGNGPNGRGTIFSLSTSGTLHVLYSFKGGSDGAYPAGIIAAFGAFYGTTTGGGTNDDGTVFSADSSGHEHVLYRFRGVPDGANPQGRLLALGGALYGTTFNGGILNSNGGDTVGTCTLNGTCGVVYEISSSGERVLYRFQGTPQLPYGGDGSSPIGSLAVLDGTLYGTTTAGEIGWIGQVNYGTLFSLTP